MPRRLHNSLGGLVCHVLNLPTAGGRSWEDWRWSSLWRRVQGRSEGLLSQWPVDEPADWLALVNRPQNPPEEQAIGRSIRKGRPYGWEAFAAWKAEAMGLQPASRERGRPRQA